MTDFGSAAPQLQAFVLELQETVHAKAQMILETALVMEGADPYPPGSHDDLVFRGGVDAGMAAMMRTLYDRGLIRTRAP